MVVVASWVGGGVRGSGVDNLRDNLCKQCLVEDWLVYPYSCPTLTWPGVLALVCVAHLVRAGRQGPTI